MPKHTTITDAAAKRFKPPKSGTVDHFDGSYPGLHLRVSASGLKTWGYYYRLKNGKVVLRRLKLGVYPGMSVEQAHDMWRKAYDLVQARRDPSVVLKADEEPSNSFESVFEEWLKRDSAKKSGEIKRSLRRTERRIRVHVLPSWRGRLITDIDRRAALGIVEDIADSGKVVLARRIFSHLHRLFVWCVGRGIIPTNPLEHAEKPGAEIPRKRVLNDEELVKVWLASEKLAPAYRDAFRLLVLTGARKQEISELNVDEIKGNDIHLEGERTKTGKPHIVPLSTVAKSILDKTERISNLFIFSTKNGPIANWTRAKQTLDEASGVTGWRIHDLRRTVATGLQKKGVALPVTEAVLGHVSGSRGGIVGVYQVHDYAAEKRAALEAWGAHVMALVDGSERGKVLAWGR
jgi:integrase